MIDAIYIHIPFCENKCNYCDFLSFRSGKQDKDEYVNYLVKEISLYPEYTYDTVYFGGGTPSLLNLKQVEKILSVLKISKSAEVTMEVNPKTVDLDYLIDLRKLGVNRLSIGIQTFDDARLKVLGRIHNSAEAIKTYENARKAGFDNISLDLIFSLPNQNLDDVKYDLKRLFDLDPEHFSIYSLIWEEGTPFYMDLQKGKYKVTDNDLEALMYEKIIESAKAKGYIHYEISNFAKSGYEARHNSKYWENREYVGVGLGASGYIDGIRYKNYVQFSKYYDIIEENKRPVMEEEILDSDDIEEYSYLLGLRLLNVGITPSEKYIERCKRLQRDGFLNLNSDGRYILSKKGLMLANDVLEEFL